MAAAVADAVTVEILCGALAEAEAAAQKRAHRRARRKVRNAAKRAERAAQKEKKAAAAEGEAQHAARRVEVAGAVATAQAERAAAELVDGILAQAVEAAAAGAQRAPGAAAMQPAVSQFKPVRDDASGQSGLVVGVGTEAGVWQTYLQQPCPYRTLGLSEGASLTPKARVRALRKAHADKGGDDKAFEEVKRAIRVLQDGRARALYDAYGWAGVLATWQAAPRRLEGGEQTDVCAASGWLLALRDGSVISTRGMTAQPDPLGVTSSVAATARGPPACWPQEVRSSGFGDCGGEPFASDPLLLKLSGVLPSMHAPTVPSDVLVTLPMAIAAADALSGRASTVLSGCQALCERLLAHRGERLPLQIAETVLTALFHAGVGDGDALRSVWHRTLCSPLPPVEGKLVLCRGREMLLGGTLASQSHEAAGCSVDVDMPDTDVVKVVQSLVNRVILIDQLRGSTRRASKVTDRKSLPDQLLDMSDVMRSLEEDVGWKPATIERARRRPARLLATPVAKEKALAMPGEVLRECKSIEIRLGSYGIGDILHYFDMARFGGTLERSAWLTRAIEVVRMLRVQEQASLAAQADVEFAAEAAPLTVNPCGPRSVSVRLLGMSEAPPDEVLHAYMVLQTCGVAELADYLFHRSVDAAWKSGSSNPERFEVLLATDKFLHALIREEADALLEAGENDAADGSTAQDVLPRLHVRSVNSDGFCSDYSVLTSLGLLENPDSPTRRDRQLVSALRARVAQRTGKPKYTAPVAYMADAHALSTDCYGDPDTIAATAAELKCDVASIDETQPQKQNLAYFPSDGSQRFISATDVLSRIDAPTATPLVIIRWNGVTGISGHYSAAVSSGSELTTPPPTSGATWRAPVWVKEIARTGQSSAASSSPSASGKVDADGQVHAVCAVCQETCSGSLTDGQLGRLDCCGHEYHFACIRPWVEEQANTCPQCNQTVAKVSRCSTAGVLEEVVIGASVDCRQKGYVRPEEYEAEEERVQSCPGCGEHANSPLKRVPCNHRRHMRRNGSSRSTPICAHVSQALASVTRVMTW